MRRILTPVLVMLALFPLGAVSDASRPRTIIDLGGVRDRDNWAMAINARGDVAGVGAFQSPQPEETRALRWTASALTALPPLPGDVGSSAEAINNRGQVVGQSVTSDFLGTPVLWERGRVIPLDRLPGQVSGGAYDINDRGEVVGVAQLFDRSTGQQRAFVWRNGVTTDLFPPSISFSSALAINNRGQIVGQAFGTIVVKEKGIVHPIELAGAYVWDRGRVTLIEGLGGINSMALDINDRGQVTGQADNAEGFFHAFLWQPGGIRDLGTLGRGHSIGLGLNNRGDVVGQADPGHAILWSGGQIIDLGSLASDSSRAEAINDRGDIAGLGFGAHGEKHAVVWTSQPERFATRWIAVDGTVTQEALAGSRTDWQPRWLPHPLFGPTRPVIAATQRLM